MFSPETRDFCIMLRYLLPICNLCSEEKGNRKDNNAYIEENGVRC